MSYDPKDYGKVRVEDKHGTEIAPSHADEASATWAAAHNYRTRCEIDAAEASTRHKQAVANECEAWNALEVAAGRAPQAAQASPASREGLGYGRNGRGD